VKQLGFLALAVIVLLGAWVAFVAIQRNKSEYAVLEIPKDPKDKQALVRSANQLWQATPGHYDPQRCVALIKLIHASVTDEEWVAVSPPIYFACEYLREAPGVEAAVPAIDEMMLSRFSRHPVLHEAESLVRVARSKKPGAARIDAALERMVVAQPLASGFEGSAASFLVAASVSAEDFRRAARYLEGIHLDEGAPVETRAALERVRRLVRLCSSAKNEKFEIRAAMEEWRKSPEDALGRAVYGPAMVNISFVAVQSVQTDSARRRSVELMTQVKDQPDAQPYWHEVIEKVLSSVLAGSTDNDPLLGAMALAYESAFAESDYAARAWKRVGQKQELRHPELLLWAAEPYEKALTAAGNPDLQAELALSLVRVYLPSREFTKARAAVEKVAAKLSAEHERYKELKMLLADLKGKETKDLARVAREKKEIERQRLVGERNDMKLQLDQAKKQKRSSEDIRSIEVSIESISKRIVE